MLKTIGYLLLGLALMIFGGYLLTRIYQDRKRRNLKRTVSVLWSLLEFVVEIALCVITPDSGISGRGTFAVIIFIIGLIVTLAQISHLFHM